MRSPQLQPHPPPPPLLLFFFFLQRGWEASLDLSIISHKLMGCRESSSLSSTPKLLPAPSSALEMPWAGSSRGSFLLGCDKIPVLRGTPCHQPCAETIHWPQDEGSSHKQQVLNPKSSPALPQHEPWVIAAQREAQCVWCGCRLGWIQPGNFSSWLLLGL